MMRRVEVRAFGYARSELEGLMWVVYLVNLHDIRLLVQYCQWLEAEFVVVVRMGCK